jgi:hypothetical protein
MDIATLTIALLRAANIPARYAYGSVDIPADRFMNMVGDFANIDAAWDFASAGGIPTTGITSGGQVSFSRRRESRKRWAGFPVFTGNDRGEGTRHFRKGEKINLFPRISHDRANIAFFH